MSDFEADLKDLRSEMAQIRADMSALATTLRDLAQSGTAELGAQARMSAHEIKDKARHTADKLAEEIHDNPLTSALTAFGVGVALGAMLGPRR